MIKITFKPLKIFLIVILSCFSLPFNIKFINTFQLQSTCQHCISSLVLYARNHQIIISRPRKPLFVVWWFCDLSWWNEKRRAHATLHNRWHHHYQEFNISSAIKFFLIFYLIVPHYLSLDSQYVLFLIQASRFWI